MDEIYKREILIEKITTPITLVDVNSYNLIYNVDYYYGEIHISFACFEIKQDEIETNIKPLIEKYLYNG